MRFCWKQCVVLASVLVSASCTVKVPEKAERSVVKEREEAVVKEEAVQEAVAPEKAAVTEEAAAEAGPFSFLRAEGTRIVGADGRPVVLKGCNLGNWFLLEMWMLDIEGVRDQYEFEAILGKRFGVDEKDRLMELYRENWITERDFEIIRSFGFNVVRLPFHYSLLEDDAQPLHLKDNAFMWLDRAVKMAEDAGLYVILDMHGLQGGQSVDHTTGRSEQNLLWNSDEYRTRAAWLWKAIALHYRKAPNIAAYDIINEPFGNYKSSDHVPALVELSDVIYKSIRAVDKDHLIFFAGTTKGIDFYGTPAEHNWNNVGFTEHFYPGLFWNGDPSPKTHALFIAQRIPWQKTYMEKVQAPFLVGEFNVVLQKAGGPPLMRRYYDIYASNGWAATMWSYKLWKKASGIGPDSWSLVKNKAVQPMLSPARMSKSEIEAYFRGFSTNEYAVFEELKEALTTTNAVKVDLPTFAAHPTQAAASDALPAGWGATDVYDAKPAGGQKVYSSTQIDVIGGGKDIYSYEDQFRFVWRKVTGDFELAATLTALAETHQYAKAGLMVRNTLDKGAATVMINFIPCGKVTTGERAGDGAYFEERTLTTGSLPGRLTLKRRGKEVEMRVCTKGGEWKSRTIAADWLTPECYVGIAVLSHDERYLTKASFKDIQVVATGVLP